MSMPVLQSLLLADHVYRDQATGKHIICGIFSTIYFTPNVPPEPPSGGFGVNSAAPGMPPGNGNLGGINPGINRPEDRGGSGGVGGPPLDSRHGNMQSDPVPPLPKSQPIQNLIQAGSPYVYFSVTELTGRKTFEVRYVELHENRSLFQAEVPIECDDPLKTIEVSLPLPRLPLVALEERVYALEILCEGQLLGSHRVLARITPGISPPAN